LVKKPPFVNKSAYRAGEFTGIFPFPTKNKRS